MRPTKNKRSGWFVEQQDGLRSSEIYGEDLDVLDHHIGDCMDEQQHVLIREYN